MNTEIGGFALVGPARMLLHELGHAYNHAQKIGPMFDKSMGMLDRLAAEELHVIEKYGNEFGDGIQRKGHKPACPYVN